MWNFGKAHQGQSSSVPRGIRWDGSTGGWKTHFQDGVLTWLVSWRRLSAESSAVLAGVLNSPPCGHLHKCLGTLIVWWQNSKSKHSEMARQKLYFLLWSGLEVTQHHESAQIFLHNRSVNLILWEEHVACLILLQPFIQSATFSLAIFLQASRSSEPQVWMWHLSA